MNQAIAPFQSVSAQPYYPPSSSKRWYLPMMTPEHGTFLVLLGALLTGASVAQAWSGDTSWACFAAFLGLQSEHPLVLQIKKRRRLYLRYVLWTTIYGGAALGIAVWLSWRHPVVLWSCGLAAIALLIDAMAVLRRKQKTIANECISFATICLASVFTYSATTSNITPEIIGFWVLNTLFFSSAIFTIKLRKTRTSALQPSLIYHAVATLILAGLWQMGWLSLLSVAAFGVALLKLAIVVWQREWYCNCRFGAIARFETYFALVYIALAALTVLPAKLPTV
ncbi:MAG: YwiC-like family protein [Cyanothece sp. SIO2G6]|nr:YwiC-like family protein [Cyanothece sp. SIO2G6]